MIAKALLYIGIFIVVRSWIRLFFKSKAQPIKDTGHRPTKSYSSKDVFDADYRVVDE